MKANLRTPGRKGMVVEEPMPLKERLLALLQADPLVNTVMVVAITVGFIHGWLKVRYPSPITTFLFDGLMLVALGLVLLRQRRGEPFFPPGNVGNAIKAFYVVCALYALMPLGPPLLIKAAAFRGWCFAMLSFSLGYKLTKSLPQVKSYFYVLILLGVATAVYGMRQSPQEIERMMMNDPDFAARYQFTYFASQEAAGRTLRVFSTFISAGAFGATMAYVLIFAIVLFTEPKVRALERWILVAASLPVAYGMVLSGSRSPLATLAFGFVVIAWFRRNSTNFVLVPALVGLALKFAANYGGGATLARLETVLNMDSLYYRNLIPTQIGWWFMQDNPLGGGLGKSSYSIPFFLISSLKYDDFVGADGDLGRLMIEMGLVGLVFFGWLVGAALRSCYVYLTRLRETPLATVSLASAACFVMAISSFPSGAPFLGIPMGALTWFFLGTLQKLADLHARGTFAQPTPTESPPTPTPAKRFLYQQSGSRPRSPAPRAPRTPFGNPTRRP